VADPLTAASVAIGAALLGVQVLREAKDAKKETPATGGAPAQPAAFLPQTRPGAADQGGPQLLYALPPGMTPRDVADLYASQGRAHDAAPVINVYQGGGVMVPLGHGIGAPPDTTGTTPVQETTQPQGGGVPQDGTTPTDPATPGPGPVPTHQDVWGRTQPGEPSAAETSLKDAFGWIGSAALIETGTAKLVVDRASLAGPVGIGLGLGLMGTQALQTTGVFDHVVRPAGTAASEGMGPDASKALATALLPLTVPGGAVKALVTPGESVAGNVQTALSKSHVPDAWGATLQGAQDAAQGARSFAGDVWGGIASPSRLGSFLGGGLSLPTVAQAAPAPVAAAIQAAPVVASALTSGAQATGDKLAQGGQAVKGFFSQRWW
jgi:hypothetical protein